MSYKEHREESFIESKANRVSLSLFTPLSSGQGLGVETRHSAAMAVLGHKYDGDILFNINSHLLLI